MNIIRYKAPDRVLHGVLVGERAITKGKRKNQRVLEVLLIEFPLRICELDQGEARYVTIIGELESRHRRTLREAAKLWHGGVRGLPARVRAILLGSAA